MDIHNDDDELEFNDASTLLGHDDDDDDELEFNDASTLLGH